MRAREHGRNRNPGLRVRDPEQRASSQPRRGCPVVSCHGRRARSRCERRARGCRGPTPRSAPARPRAAASSDGGDAGRHREQDDRRSEHDSREVAERSANAVRRADRGEADRGRARASHDRERAHEQCDEAVRSPQPPRYGLPMQETLRGAVGDGLERSCDWIRPGAGAPGLERAEAFFSERAFELHRHDTYAVGITCSGVQAFRYRGAQRIALPGQLHVLHPDELHDGGPATEEGFRYRIVYVEPELIRRALDDAPAPLRRRPGPGSRRLRQPSSCACSPTSTSRSAISARAEIAASVADVLQALAGRTVPFGADRPCAPSSSCGTTSPRTQTSRRRRPTLERIAGLDRFAIARHFRRAFGTSPDRYRTMRRLELARAAIARGVPLVRAAARGRVRRPEPPDPSVQAGLRNHPRHLGRGRSQTEGARVEETVAPGKPVLSRDRARRARQGGTHACATVEPRRLDAGLRPARPDRGIRGGGRDPCSGARPDPLRPDAHLPALVLPRRRVDHGRRPGRDSGLRASTRSSAATRTSRTSACSGHPNGS